MFPKRWEEYFRLNQKPAPDDDMLLTARQILSFTEHPQYARMMAWIDVHADARIKIGEGPDFVADAARSNTFKELRDHLRAEVSRAKQVIGLSLEE